MEKEWTNSRFIPTRSHGNRKRKAAEADPRARKVAQGDQGSGLNCQVETGLTMAISYGWAGGCGHCGRISPDDLISEIGSIRIVTRSRMPFRSPPLAQPGGRSVCKGEGGQGRGRGRRRTAEHWAMSCNGDEMSGGVAIHKAKHEESTRGGAE